MKLGTREILREIDRLTIEKYGIPGVVLMENAGRAVTRAATDNYPQINRVAVMCGGGNNGGDGFVIARHLIKRGRHVDTYILKNRKDYTGDAKTNLEILENTNANIIKLRSDFSNFSPCELIIDAVFGTGLDREVNGLYAKVIDFINGSNCQVISVDVPSGLDANSGKLLGTAVKADITVTFVVPKLGLAVYPGADYTGKLYVADISTPSLLEDGIPDELITFKKCKEILKPRENNTHKGTYGHLLVIAGSPGKSGAAYLSSCGAARAGTGLVTAAIPSSIAEAMEQKTTETMTESVPSGSDGCFGSKSLEKILSLLNGKSAVAAGPGISTGTDTKNFLYDLLGNLKIPVVADADAVNIIAVNTGVLKDIKVPLILTPHPGEMARLCGVSSKDVQDNRISFARDFSTKYGVYIVLKGARTVVSTPEGNIYINPTGNAGMASGGMGDVLTGMISGFLAQGYTPEESCILGVFIHGLAGDMVSSMYGSTGFYASEVADMVPEAVDRLTGADSEPFFELIY